MGVVYGVALAVVLLWAVATMELLFSRNMHRYVADAWIKESKRLEYKLQKATVDLNAARADLDDAVAQRNQARADHKLLRDRVKQLLED